MKHILVAFLLISISGGAFAEWVKISVAKEGIFYTDSDNSIRSGNRVKMWMMLDLTSAALHGLTGKPDAGDTTPPTRKADVPDNSISCQNTG